MVGDGERIAISAIAELEPALEVSAPKIVGLGALGERRSGCALAPSHPLDEAVPIEHRMDRALRGYAHVAGEAPDQQLTDLTRTPMGFILLGPDDHSFNWLWQLVGVTDGPSRSIGQRIQAMMLIPIEYLVARLARNAELATQLAHRFTVQQADNEAHTLFHYRTLLPRHRHLPHAIACGRCNMV